MAILPIVIGPDNPILRTKTKKVPKVTKEIKQLIKDMIETMHEASGVGLASPQVNRTERICIAVIGGKITPLINPKITSKSKETDIDQEGCLSLPNVWLMIPRSIEIKLDYVDLQGKKQQRKLMHFDARVVQHEVDHLEGVLIVDYPHSSLRSE
ncbi:MAG: peptide deformylase [Candidatus Peribacteraceae bacterium]|nr:peptide deformylase [Candidatus Peribacteraceae bacterium]